MNKNLILMAVAYFIANTAYADSAWYMGVAGGSGEVEVVGHERGPDVRKVLNKTGLGITTLSAGEKDGTNVWKVFTGYQINNHFAIEASYQDLGHTSGHYTATVTQNGTTSTLSGKLDSEYQAASTSLLGQWSFNEWVGVFGRVGMHYWEHEFSVKGSNAQGVSVNKTENDNGFDYLFGGGLSANLADNISVRAEWERFHGIEDEDGIDIKTVSVVYRF
ncbi:outer membrane beta-barrel protein [Endozoicomonadaceae bacterium StTr2]